MSEEIQDTVDVANEQNWDLDHEWYTFWERTVRFSLLEDKVIQDIKKHYAEIIDALDLQRQSLNQSDVQHSWLIEEWRLLSIAITKLEESCMFAVKAITTN